MKPIKTLPPIGKKAPTFTAPDQNGNLVSLKDFAGKKVILYFYPHDDTPTCTAQACNLRDNFFLLTARGYCVLGVSTDAMKKHGKFISKYNLPFPLIADEDHTIAAAYGVWGEKKFMGRTFDGIHRTTFIINENGQISNIIAKPISKKHAEEILAIAETT